MRNRRDRRHGNNTVVHVTNRTLHGLPFVCSPLVEAIILGVMARGQALYPVIISHYLWMANHYHMILSGHPALISPFMGYIESEIAKAIMRLIPEFYTKNVWAGRFKEQRLGSAAAVIEKISYIYNNPVRAGLVKSIEQYPGVSSYKAFKNDDFSLLSRFHRSSSLKALHSKDPLTYLMELRKAEQKKDNKAPLHTLTVSPYAWKGAFGETKKELDRDLKKRIMARIVANEAKHNEARLGTVLGAPALRCARMDRPYKPKSKSRTPYVICDDKERRKILIQEYRDFCALCRAAWKAFKAKLKPSLDLPYGAYSPSLGVGRAATVKYS